MTEINIAREGAGTFPVALAEALPGDEIVYHIGRHAGGPHKSDAGKAYEEGRCLLYQRRLGPGLFKYCARKR